ncbi:hypothetical protein DFJ74DRAFT_710602 [Hyaloraphidium curvatum]|nr:hypothetical protein DFJ74DRAFT_710602 [Hyaloraphidium curvatum]
MKAAASLVNRFFPLFQDPRSPPHATRRKLAAATRKRLDNPDVLFLLGQALELAIYLLAGPAAKRGWVGLEPSPETRKALQEAVAEFGGNRRILLLEVEDEARELLGLFDASCAAEDLGIDATEAEKDPDALREKYRAWVNTSQKNLGIALGYPTAGDSHPGILGLGTMGRMTVHVNFRLSPPFLAELAAKAGFNDPNPDGGEGEPMDVPFVINFAGLEKNLGDNIGKVFAMYAAIADWAKENDVGVTELYIENSGVLEAHEALMADKAGKE